MRVAYSIEFRALPAVYGEDDRRICVSGVVEMPDATTRDGCCDAYCSFHYDGTVPPNRPVPARGDLIRQQLGRGGVGNAHTLRVWCVRAQECVHVCVLLSTELVQMIVLVILVLFHLDIAITMMALIYLEHNIPHWCPFRPFESHDGCEHSSFREGRGHNAGGRDRDRTGLRH